MAGANAGHALEPTGLEQRTVAMTTRREILLRAAGAAPLLLSTPCWPQGMPRVAWLSPFTASDGSLFFEELRQGLREAGYVEGRNIVLDAYWGDDSGALIETVAAAAAAARPAVIVAQGTAVFAARKAAPTIPIVFGYSGDAVEAGLVQSMAHPGGHVTGISYMTMELVGKRVQLLKETLPNVQRVAVIAFPQHPGDLNERRSSEEAAKVLGLALEYFEARNAADLAAALALIEKSRNQALVLFPVQTVIARRERIAEWSIRNKIPTISGWAQFADGGNLMSYGPNLRAACRRLAYFVDRILKGTKPADLPVEQPLRVELVVNAKTAKALGIAIPPAVLLRADRVIE
jgi:putative ABC transport system substrate-binding protein